jgi:hypothetical protein
MLRTIAGLTCAEAITLAVSAKATTASRFFDKVVERPVSWDAHRASATNTDLDVTGFMQQTSQVDDG